MQDLNPGTTASKCKALTNGRRRPIRGREMPPVCKADRSFTNVLFRPKCSPPSNGYLWPLSRKSRKLFGPENPFLKLRLVHSVKLVFLYVVKGRKIKITARFRALRRIRFENTKRTISPEMRPKSFGTVEKRALGPVQSPSDPSFIP